MISSASLAVLLDLEMTFKDSPYFWSLVSLACVAVQKLHSRIADARYTETDRLYCCYVFSVITLAPASLYLEEAFEVLNFPHASRLDFMAACIGVGVLGLLLAVHSIKMQHVPRFGFLDAVSKLITSIVSLLIFEDTTNAYVKGLVVVSLLVGLFVPQFEPMPPPAEDPDQEEMAKFLAEMS